MQQGILLSNASEIDFMIHGVFPYSFFGHEVWITTTHICLLIVMLVIIGLAVAANRVMRPPKCRAASRMWWSWWWSFWTIW